MTPLKWNSWVRVRRTDVYGKTPRAADIIQGPQDAERGRVLHSSLPGSIPRADARAGGGHARRCSPHTPPPHLNTISQDVETISILEGGKRDWLANRLLGVDWSFAGLQEWPLWLGSCLESLANFYFRGGSDDCLLQSFLFRLRSLSLTESCWQAQIPVTASDRKLCADWLRPKACITLPSSCTGCWAAHLCHPAPTRLLEQRGLPSS